MANQMGNLPNNKGLPVSGSFACHSYKNNSWNTAVHR